MSMNQKVLTDEEMDDIERDYIAHAIANKGADWNEVGYSIFCSHREERRQFRSFIKGCNKLQQKGMVRRWSGELVGPRYLSVSDINKVLAEHPALAILVPKKKRLTD